MATHAVDLRAAPGDQMVGRAMGLFAEAVKRRYGNRLRGLYLFGSRARGDHKPHSDIDVAVVVGREVSGRGETKPLTEAAYDIFLETGAEIQPWLFHEDEWSTAAGPRARLVRAAKRDARTIGVT
ncbi:MAG TPA: nucleotidyltransferase domain-containing protein [Bauldia sp.]|nr:nucleotidyltransferase domain-containing protein [Bauldia sp.]